MGSCCRSSQGSVQPAMRRQGGQGSSNKGDQKLSIYHERQVKQLCALHTLNNLFQQKDTFTKKDLDDICTKLNPSFFFNPHRTIFGTGNYDVNVIITALSSKHYEMKWFDKRKSLDSVVFENVFGFIINRPNEFKLGNLLMPLDRKHWLAVRCVGGAYYNLDSKLTRPGVLGTESDAKRFLQDHVDSPDAQLFVVISDEVCKDESWCKPSS